MNMATSRPTHVMESIKLDRFGIKNYPMRNEIMKNVQRDLRNDAAAPLAGSTDKALFHSDMGTIVLYHTGVKEHQPLFERIFRAHHYLWLTQGMELRHVQILDSHVPYSQWPQFFHPNSLKITTRYWIHCQCDSS